MLKRLHLLSYSLLFLGMCISFVSTVTAQNEIEVDSLKSPRIPYRKTLDPQLLVAQLIVGKETQKEKFDVIFSWVANNINYNHRQANSGAATNYNSIKRILRRRKGVCSDFARLMDSLCKYAGIQNTTVNGYAKEFIFDVSDSLYFENHAWNAVKLKDKWFLYDVTWTAGETKYDFTRFGKWRQKVIKKFEKHKKEKIRIYTIKKTRKDKFCGVPRNIEKDTSRYKVQRPFYRFLTAVINFFPYRIKPVHNYIRRTDYYLTNPEVFALEHFPLDSIWSLSPKFNSLDSFRLDSTYFYDHGNGFAEQFDGQVREGRHCFDCDDYLGLSSFDKEKYNIKIAKIHLPQNPFFKATSELNVANIFFKDFFKENDSTKKFSLYDSTLIYLNSSYTDFRKCSGPIASEYRFHVAKNRAKTAQLKMENKAHIKKVAGLFLQVNRRKKKIASLVSKSDMYEQRSIKAFRKFGLAFSVKSSSKLKEEKLKALQSDYNRAVHKSDSLTALIGLKRLELMAQSKELKNGLIDHLEIIEPYLFAFEIDNYLRYPVLFDSYDLTTIETRKTIDSLEYRFVTNVERDVLVKADTMYSTFMKLYRSIYERDQANIKVARLGTLLKSQGKLSSDSLNLFRSIQYGRMKDDICWNREQKGLIQFLQGNFIIFYNHYRSILSSISKNNARELKRNKFTQKYIEVKRKRIYNAKEGNSKIVRYLKKLTYSEMSKFKKELKKKK